jgi:hypothetical protein
MEGEGYYGITTRGRWQCHQTRLHQEISKDIMGVPYFTQRSDCGIWEERARDDARWRKTVRDSVRQRETARDGGRDVERRANTLRGLQENETI